MQWHAIERADDSDGVSPGRIIAEIMLAALARAIDFVSVEVSYCPSARALVSMKDDCAPI